MESSVSDSNGWASYGSSQCANASLLKLINPLTVIKQNPDKCSGDQPNNNKNIREKGAKPQKVLSNQRTKSEKPTKKRSNLRKGKWTVEEEEYTTRIIHFFRTGLLTPPEGLTLRSYLAEKLNCDPMRITKKFAGASCLGKRVYHLCERSTVTVADIEIAKAELAKLEQRFHLRVEQSQLCAPSVRKMNDPEAESAASRVGIGLIPINHSSFSAGAGSQIVPGTNLVFNTSTPNAWTTNYSNTNQGSSNPPLTSLILPSQVSLIQGSNMQTQASFNTSSTPSQWSLMSVPGTSSLAANVMFPSTQSNILQIPVNNNLVQNSQMNNEALPSFAYTQAQNLAAISPSLTQIANKNVHSISQANINGQIISPQLDLSQCSFGPGLSLQTALSHQLLNHHQQQQQQQQQHHHRQQQQHIILPQVRSAPIADFSSSSKVNLITKENSSVVGSQGKLLKSANDRSHTKEDEDAGRMLLGFISELRKKHLDALSTDPAADKLNQDASVVSKTSDLNKSGKDLKEIRNLSVEHKVPTTLPRNSKRPLSRIHSPTNLSPIMAVENKIDKEKPLRLITTNIEKDYPEEMIRSDYSWPQGQYKVPNPHISRQATIISATDYDTASSISANTRLQGFVTTETSSGSTSVPCDLSGGEYESSSSNEANSIRDKMNADYSECAKGDNELGSISSEEGNDKSSGPIRKRRKRHILAFTSRNVSDHNNRMAAIQRHEQLDASSGIGNLHSILESNKKRDFQNSN